MSYSVAWGDDEREVGIVDEEGLEFAGVVVVDATSADVDVVPEG